VEFDILRDNVASAAAYSCVGVVLMILGFVAVDVVTPGKLRQQVWIDRNRNACILVASNTLAVAIIIVAAITASEGDLGEGLLYTVIYTVIGIFVMAFGFVLVDALSPGDLGEVLMDDQPHPAVWVSATIHVGAGLIIAASLL
jgi:uncharacterized membrane protein YjfL (UPF0719 family)